MPAAIAVGGLASDGIGPLQTGVDLVRGREQLQVEAAAGDAPRAVGAGGGDRACLVPDLAGVEEHAPDHGPIRPPAERAFDFGGSEITAIAALLRGLVAEHAARAAQVELVGIGECVDRIRQVQLADEGPVTRERQLVSVVPFAAGALGTDVVEALAVDVVLAVGPEREGAGEAALVLEAARVEGADLEDRKS